MQTGNLVQEYEKRLTQMPTISKETQEEVRKYTSLVNQQEQQIQSQQIKIKLLEEQMAKIDKVLEIRENQIQEMTENQEKNHVKEKKYFMQIQNYNKKIQSIKPEIAKTQKNIIILKKDIKNLQSSISTSNSEKNRSLQQLTKQQLKINTLTQSLNDLKLKAMEKANNKNEGEINDGKVEEKQINELFSAIKKQMMLIDILKKQKTHVIASTVFKYCESDFTKLLQLNKQ